MKKYMLITMLGMITMAGMLHIQLIGAIAGGGGNIQVAEWQPSDPSSLAVYPTNLQSYLLTSSVFDAWNGNYYLTGETSSGFGLFSFNSVTNQQVFSNFSAFSNITEIDMSTAKIYTLTMEQPDTILVNEYDIASGSTTLLGVVAEPGLPGIVVDATGFDSNHGILYYLGSTNTGEQILYGMNVRNPVFSYTRVPLIGAPSFDNMTGLNYDNVNDRLYGLKMTYDSSFTFSECSVTGIDYLSGVITEVGVLGGITGYLVGSCTYDQLTGSFIVAGVDTTFVLQLIIFSTSDSTFTTGYLPNGVSEIVCDNNSYARSAYTSVGDGKTREGALKVWPVPAREYIRVEQEKPATLRIIDSQGHTVITRGDAGVQSLIPLTGLPAGLYMIERRTGNQVNRSRFVKAE